MIEKTYIDPLYDYIEVDKKIRDIVNKDSIIKELERIEDINHLGIIQKIYTLSKHSKFEHGLGVYHLTWMAGNIINPQIKKANIQLDNLKLAAILHGIGHLPYTYSTERAIYGLYGLNENINIDIESITSFVCEMLGISGRKKTNHMKFLSQGEYRELHRWFEAYKILKNKTIPDSHRKEVARYIVDTNSSGYQLLRFLDRIDYVIRDAHYINLFSLKLNLVPFIKGIKISKDGSINAPSDINVLGSYYQLLSEKVYRNPKVIGVENIFSRMIIDAVKDNDITIYNLLNLVDSDLNQYLAPYKFGSKTIDIKDLVSMVKNEEILNICKNIIISSNKKDPLSLEKNIVHKNGSNIFEYPKSDEYFVDIEKISPNLLNSIPLKGRKTFDIHVFWNKSNGDPKNVLRSMMEIQTMCLNEPAILKENIAKFIIGQNINSDYARIKNKVFDDINTFIDTTGSIDDFSNYLSKEYIYYDQLGYFLKLPIEDKADIIKNLFIDWLIESPEIFELKLITDLSSYLSDIGARGPHKEILKEYIQYLKRSCDALEAGTNRWVLPSLEIINDDNGNKLREIDVFSIEFKDINTKPVIHMDEVSVTHSDKKRISTKRKFGHITKLVASRFPRKIKFVYYFNDEVMSID